MKQTFFYLTIVMMCALGTTASAQDTATPETSETATPETQPETATEAQPEAAETPTEAATQTEEFPVADENQEPSPGQVYLRETHGPWEVRCVKAAEDAAEGSKEPCRLYQLLSDEENVDVAEINLQRLPDGGKAAAGVDFASPLGSLLTAKVVMRVDSGKAKRYDYSWCDKYGCFARFGLRPQEIKNMRKGASAKITIFAISAPKKPIILTMSLKGFTAAWNAIAP